MEDDGEDQFITLLNPWCQPVSGSELHKIKSCELSGSNNGSYFLTRHLTAKLRLGWREIYTYFDTIHLSWDPTSFSKTYYFHG